MIIVSPTNKRIFHRQDENQVEIFIILKASSDFLILFRTWYIATTYAFSFLRPSVRSVERVENRPMINVLNEKAKKKRTRDFFPCHQSTCFHEFLFNEKTRLLKNKRSIKKISVYFQGQVSLVFVLFDRTMWTVTDAL